MEISSSDFRGGCSNSRDARGHKPKVSLPPSGRRETISEDLVSDAVAAQYEGGPGLLRNTLFIP